MLQLLIDLIEAPLIPLSRFRLHDLAALTKSRALRAARKPRQLSFSGHGLILAPDARQVASTLRQTLTDDP
jgi:hypothetical protein